MAGVAPFKRGEFVRLKTGLAGSVGVVWQIQPKSISSVVVYWRESETSRMQQAHEPKDLVLVTTDAVPDYAIKLKESLGL